MSKQKKIILISGSPRHGNTDFVLDGIYKNTENFEREIIYLRDKNIGHCRGCLACHNESKCVILDEMREISDKILAADFLIIGTPNYFDNVSGLMKNFIDRLHPFYKQELVRGKKIILIYVGGGEIEGTTKYLDLAFYGFVKYLKLKLLGSFSFQALDTGELKKRNDVEEIKKIIEKLK